MHSSILPQIAAVIGEPLKIDEYTLKGIRGKFARVCILLDVRKPIQQDIWIDTKYGSFFQTVAYENISVLCFHCGRIGHREANCKLKNGDDNLKMKDADYAVEEKEEKDVLGPWVQVQKKKFVKKEVVKVNKQMENPFVVLDNPTFEKNMENRRESEARRDEGKNKEKGEEKLYNVQMVNNSKGREEKTSTTSDITVVKSVQGLDMEERMEIEILTKHMDLENITFVATKDKITEKGKS
ncbi:hypothetical protein Cni_G09528 [Canna indica]|uniref:CCHC-type domain-containing protein n=1 Tax=Canna indica TaxID=4628 RepID=A0AAQ3K4H0_9LILI|nr:hypothetical protein Cni_G09528 [Canna indica]